MASGHSDGGSSLAGPKGVLRELARRLGARRAWLVPEMPAVPAPPLVGASGVVRRVCTLDGMNRVCDVRALGQACREASLRARREGSGGFDPALLNDLLVVDVSSVSCAGMMPVRLGAHVALDDLSLVLADEEPAPLGLRAVALSQDAERTRPGITAALDAAQDQASIDDAVLEAIARGLATLDERMRCLNDHAAVIAAFLAAHPAVRRVHYPGLPADPSHEVAARQLQGGFGPRVVAELWQGSSPLVVEARRDDPLVTCMELEGLLGARDGS